MHLSFVAKFLVEEHGDWFMNVQAIQLRAESNADLSVMEDEQRRDVRWCDYPPKSDDYWIYYIWNRVDDIIYVGISRDPKKRIKQHIKGSQDTSKTQLCRDYERFSAANGKLETQDSPFVSGLLFSQGVPYEHVLVGCITEVLHIFNLRAQGQKLYNRSLTGGHKDLKQYGCSKAFNAAVSILDPTDERELHKEDVNELLDNMRILRKFVEETQGKDLLNESVLERLKQGAESYLKRQVELRIEISDRDEEGLALNELQKKFSPDTTAAFLNAPLID